jgi:hypothetical protein
LALPCTETARQSITEQTATKLRVRFMLALLLMGNGAGLTMGLAWPAPKGA